MVNQSGDTIVIVMVIMSLMITFLIFGLHGI